jgi:hypothetical protein
MPDPALDSRPMTLAQSTHPPDLRFGAGETPKGR